MKILLDGFKFRGHLTHMTNTNHFTSQNYIDIHGAFSDRDSIAEMLNSARKEKERIYKQLEIADKSSRSDRKEWKIRHEHLHNIIRGLEFLSVQIMVTSGRIPAI